MSDLVGNPKDRFSCEVAHIQTCIFSAGETAVATIETFKVGCSQEMTTRIDKITNLFGGCTTLICPQEIEEETNDAVTPCNWQSCVDKIMPYLKAVHGVGSCR